MNSVVCLVLELVINRLWVISLHGCIMSPRDLPDIYTLTLGSATLRLGVHIRQITQVHDATITYDI